MGPSEIYDYLDLLHNHVLGSYKDLAYEIVVDNLMLDFLDNYTNSKDNPNENFARDFFELFTIGKGAQIVDSNYTTYTEDDVRTAARSTSMRDLAEAVDLKASSLYNHIGSKEEILKEICMANANKFSAGMQEVLSSEASPIEKIKSLINMHVDIAMSDYTSVTSFNDEWRHLGEPSLSIFKEKRKSYEHAFLSIIKDGIKEGQIQEINPIVCLFTILSSTQWVYDTRLDLKQSQISTDIKGMLIKGIQQV